MSQEENKEGISRRDFLKDAGLVVGGAAVGSVALATACGKTTTVTDAKTVTLPPITTTSTVNVTKYIDPVDGTEYPSLDAMKSHFNIVHPNADISLVGFTVNGVGYGFQVKPYWSLARVLREGLGLFALKEGCNLGECAACTVLVDGQAVLSCLTLAVEMENRTVLTVEGLSNNGVLNPIQQKWYDNEVPQCGFCTPGFLMAAQGLITSTPKPTLDEVRSSFAGHMCMCGNMHRHVNATVGGV